MCNKNIRAQKMAIAYRGRAKTPIIFFTITATKCGFVKDADLVERSAIHPHTKTDAGWNFYILLRIDCGENVIKIDQCITGRHRLAFADFGIAAQGGIVRKWRHGSRFCVGFSARQYPVEPIAVDQRIAIQQQNIAGGMKRDCAITSGHKPQIIFIAEKRDLAIITQPREELRHSWLRAGVIDNHQLKWRIVYCGEHAFNARAGFGKPAINGNDNVNGIHVGFSLNALVNINYSLPTQHGEMDAQYAIGYRFHPLRTFSNPDCA